MAEETKVEEQNKDWYFTFCGNHDHAHGYVKINGTHESARVEMFKRFDGKWGFQYASADEAGVNRFNLYEVFG